MNPRASWAATALLLAACAGGSDVTESQVSTDVSSEQSVIGDVTVSGDAVEAEVPEGFDLIDATITSAEGEVCEVCVWLADDDAQRHRGLMGVTDLGDGVAMAFRWAEPTAGNFYMFQTPTPLSIAWFGESGEHVGQADMEPCLGDDPADCELYSPDASYSVAIETFGGELDSVGIGPGSTVELSARACVPSASTDDVRGSSQP